MAANPISPAVAGTLLVGLRGGLTVGWVAPATLAKVFGMDPAHEPTLPYLMRLFTARDGALAFLTAASKGDARRLVLTTGVVVDVADAVAGVISGATRKVPPASAALATLTAVGAAALGVIAVRD